MPGNDLNFGVMSVFCPSNRTLDSLAAMDSALWSEFTDQTTYVRSRSSAASLAATLVDSSGVTVPDSTVSNASICGLASIHCARETADSVSITSESAATKYQLSSSAEIASIALAIDSPL